MIFVAIILLALAAALFAVKSVLSLAAAVVSGIFLPVAISEDMKWRVKRDEMRKRAETLEANLEKMINGSYKKLYWENDDAWEEIERRDRASKRR